MKRALLIGIDEYEGFSPLAGCTNDVHAVAPLLERNEDDTPAFDCQIRTSDSSDVTRDALLTDLDRLLAPGADVALLYFAGHGSVSDDDVSLVAADGTNATPGIKFSEVLAKIAASPVGEIIVMLDCCFSGAAGTVPQLGIDWAVLRSGVSILTASRGDQAAAEDPQTARGLFSTFVCGGLEGGAADVLGKVTIAGLYSYLDESFGPWDQRPVFKANVDRLNELRRCNPAVPIPELRRISEFFREADFELPLDPSYEPDAPPHHPEHEAVFAILQKYRAAKLVEPVEAEHMYFAAMQSKACRLTPLGRHYWRMAKEGRL